jgi:hypothetical protein
MDLALVLLLVVRFDGMRMQFIMFMIGHWRVAMVIWQEW